MRGHIILGLFLVFMAGCDLFGLDQRRYQPTYYWNTESGRAHEGRCYEVNPGVDMIVNSELCGR